MAEFVNLAFLLALSFMAFDYTLGRATVKDPLRAIIAAVLAVLFVLVVKSPDLLK